MAPIVGIDLGTTNTCVAYVSNKIPHVIPIEAGYNTMPSVVALLPTGDVLVGQAAKEQMLLNPRHTVVGIKRLLGRRYDSKVARGVSRRFAYRVAADARGDAVVEIDQAAYTPVDVQAKILAQVKRYSELHLGEELPEVVIAVPAYFNDQQRRLVERAGEAAGWRVRRLVNEPTAAALAYGFNRGFDQKILIYDLGGGTFDVSVLEITGNVFQVIGTGGDTFLGGADFDDRIIAWLLEAFRRSHRIDLSHDARAMQQLRGAAEHAKIQLSILANTTVRIRTSPDRRGKATELEAVLDRGTLNRLARDLIDRTLDVCEQVLNDCGLSPADIDEIITVGGQTRMPRVTESIAARLGKAPRQGIHPDECVALGAALLGDSLGAIDAVTLLETVSMPLGIANASGTLQPVIERNTRLPHSAEVEVPTERDQQDSLEVDIYQGSEGPLADAEYLGTVVCHDLPPAPAGEVRVVLHFQLDEEGMLDVRATEPLSGREEQLTLTTLDRAPVSNIRDTSDAATLQEPTAEEDPGDKPGGLRKLVRSLWR